MPLVENPFGLDLAAGYYPQPRFTAHEASQEIDLGDLPENANSSGYFPQHSDAQRARHAKWPKDTPYPLFSGDGN